MKRNGYKWLIIMLPISMTFVVACGGSDSGSEDEQQSCLIDTDCDIGMRCINDLCINGLCETIADCLGGEHCEIPEGSPKGFCISDQIAPDGDSEPPPDGDEPPVGACLSGDKRCKGDNLERCELRNGLMDWRFMEDCDYGCRLGKCEDPPEVDGDEDVETEPEPICTPDDRQCYDNQVQRCPADGLEWKVEDACLQGTCIEDGRGNAECGPKLICQPGMRMCSEEFNAVQICNNLGSEWNLMYCANTQACINSTCQASGECRKGHYRCNNNTVEVCNSAGTGWNVFQRCGESETCTCGTYAGTECIAAACEADVICMPLLDTRCSGDVLQRCAADGKSWAFWEECANGCANGECM